MKSKLTALVAVWLTPGSEDSRSDRSKHGALAPRRVQQTKVKSIKAHLRVGSPLPGRPAVWGRETRASSALDTFSQIQIF